MGKDAQKASPMVLNTTPPLVSMAARRSASWRAKAMRIMSGCSSHKRVEPSMSVKRKVMVPLGMSIMRLGDQVGNGCPVRQAVNYLLQMPMQKQTEGEAWRQSYSEPDLRVRICANDSAAASPTNESGSLR